MDYTDSRTADAASVGVMKSSSARKIVLAGAVAAVYAALTIVEAPIAYGPVQFRIAEALCVLPFFFPATVPGLFVGCIIANLLSPYGILDIVAGAAASLLAALATMLLGRIKRSTIAVKAIACFPPVILNAIIIGGVIAWASTGGGGAFWAAFAVSGIQVGLGQLAVLYILGLPLMIYLPKTRVFNYLSKY